MFEFERVPSRDNASYLLPLLSRHNIKKNDERTIECKVSKDAKIRHRYNQVPKSAVANVTIRSTKYTQQSAYKGFYSHLLVSKGKGR